MQSKVKVKREQLLKAVRERRAAIVKQHAKEVEAQTGGEERYQAAVVKALEVALEKARRGVLPARADNYRFHGLAVPCKAEPPRELNLHTSQIDRLIRTLEMGAEDVIAISVDDAAEYLG